IAREDVPGDKRLVAYLVAGPDVALAATELRATLAQTLPEHMLPAAFVLLDELPLTANGKLDRGALPVPDDTHVEKQEYVPPRDATEQALTEIWQDVLSLQQVGIDDNFFRVGGHSLLATRVMAQIAATLQRR